MKVLFSSPAGHPQGSWPAEARAAEERKAGNPDAEVIMDRASDDFLVVIGRTPKEQ
ncbi:hypothetical protein [Streptomyces sp. S1D4-14]|uniref:hypothetical protein n=1 Tax=Streptomyces sp. S1D4-14 TaxID=2594461 RepID=UPI0015E7BEF9|nr:hypothetical protein [Streptomyces sp. S1D4-14]